MSRPRRSSRLTNPVNYAEDDKAEGKTYFDYREEKMIIYFVLINY